MKRIVVLLCVALVAGLGYAQSVTKIELAKDNGKGKPGSVVKSFGPKDNPFHCLIHLKPLTGSMTFSGVLIAVNAAGVHNYRVAATELGASSGMDLVDFKFSLPRDWPVGSYRIELKANGKPLKEVSFEVKA